MGIIEKWTRRRGPRELPPPTPITSPQTMVRSKSAGPSLEGRDMDMCKEAHIPEAP